MENRWTDILLCVRKKKSALQCHGVRYMNDDPGKKSSPDHGT